MIQSWYICFVNWNKRMYCNVPFLFKKILSIIFLRIKKFLCEFVIRVFSKRPYKFSLALICRKTSVLSVYHCSEFVQSAYCYDTQRSILSFPSSVFNVLKFQYTKFDTIMNYVYIKPMVVKVGYTTYRFRIK